ncbi:signal peptide peptidase SppA [Candidatus Micrarchaeota archaeon]|nr:signal peptide peptidase SppA [Candidatus Micrarchaeota archaeon]
MEPEPRRRPVRPTSLIISTGLLLALIFAAVLLVFFVLSSLSPLFVGKCVAVVDMNMPLTIEGSPPSLFDSGYASSEQLATSIESLNGRDDVGAVLFIVNSPGGSVVATREVYGAVDSLNKPSVSYFREVAASGAYYVASGTDYIITDPDALTGSIGVIATFTEMQGLFEKLGINVTTVKSGQYKDIGSPYRNMTDEEKAIMQSVVDEVFQEFRGIVLENRGDRLNQARFNEVADGRILSGRQAVAVGLADEVGTKKDAIMKAAELGGIQADRPEDVRICQVSTGATEGGLFSMEAILRGIQASSGVPTLSFK